MSKEEIKSLICQSALWRYRPPERYWRVMLWWHRN